MNNIIKEYYAHQYATNNRLALYLDPKCHSKLARKQAVLHLPARNELFEDTTVV